MFSVSDVLLVCPRAKTTSMDYAFRCCDLSCGVLVACRDKYVKLWKSTRCGKCLTAVLILVLSLFLVGGVLLAEAHRNRTAGVMYSTVVIVLALALGPWAAKWLAGFFPSEAHQNAAIVSIFLVLLSWGAIAFVVFTIRGVSYTCEDIFKGRRAKVSQCTPPSSWIIAVPPNGNPNVTYNGTEVEAFPQANTLSALQIWVGEHMRAFPELPPTIPYLDIVIYEPSGEDTWSRMTGPEDTPLVATTRRRPYHVQARTP